MALFTPETAAIAIRKRWASERERKTKLATVSEPSQADTDNPLDFARLRLTRVRNQLDRLDLLASEETDPKRLKEYADATSRLQEQERQLAGRPLPGTLKPSNKPQSHRRAMPEPVPCGTEPTISSVPSATNEPVSPKSLE